MKSSGVKTDKEFIDSPQDGNSISLEEAAKRLGISTTDVQALIKSELLTQTAPGVVSKNEVEAMSTNHMPTVAQEAAQVSVGLQREIATSLSLVRKIVIAALACGAAYIATVAAFVTLYSVNPTKTAGWITQKNPSPLQALLQQPGAVALTILKYTAPTAYKEVAKVTIVNPNDILTVNKSGSISTTSPLLIQSSDFLQVLTTGLIKNLNADFVRSKTPGVVLGDLAVIGAVGAPDNNTVTAAKITDGAVETAKIKDGAVTTGKLADNAVTSAKIADGTITGSDLTTITDANKVSGSAVQLSGSGGLTNNSGLSLLTTCSDTQILQWNGSNNSWECTANAGLTGAGITAIREAAATIVSIPTAINFDGNDFAITESPTGVGNVAIDYTNSKIVRGDQNESITGVWSFPSGLTLATQTFGSHTITDSGALTIQTTTNSALTLDSGTTGNVNIGTGANAKAVVLGSSTVGTTLALTGGSTWSMSSAGTLSTTGNITTTGTGAITSAGTLTASNGLTQTTGATNLTGTSGALSLTGLGASSINTGSNALTFTSSNFNTTATGINSTAIGATTPSTGAFSSLSSTGATNIGSGTGVVTINSSGALNLTAAAPSTWNLGANALTLSASNIGVSSTGVITVAGGQTQDLTTAAGSGPTTLTIRPGNNTTNSGTGALTTVSGGNASGTTSTGGNLTLTAGTGTSANGAINVGTTNTSAITIGATGITTTNNGALTSTQTLTASNGLTLTTGAINLTGTSGTLSLTGLGASSINTGSNALTITSSNFNTTATGINGTAIGATTPSTGSFTNITGLTFALNTNTSGNILVADGSKFNSVPLSGDATIDSTGLLSLNYTSGQSADATHKGFLTATDWTTFNSKQSALGFTAENVANKSTATTLGTSDVLYPSQNAVKTYVDNIATGLIWQNPVELINVVADASSPPVSPVSIDGYIINTGGNTGAWSTFAAGDLVQYQGSSWVKIKSLAVGDWFGVAFKSSTTPSGGLTGKKNYLAQVTGGSSGAFTYTFTAPANNDAVFVQNANAFYHGVSFVYSSSLGQWVQLSSSSTSFTFANGLSTTGSTIALGDLSSDWNQTGVFNINTAGDISINGGDLKTTNTTGMLFNDTATTLNIGGAATTIGLGAAGATVTGGGALTIKSGSGTALSLDSGTTGGINIGTGANAKAVVLGSSTVGTTLALTGGATWSMSTAGNLLTAGNVTTTGSGAVTSAGTLTASNGLTLTTGAINLTGTSGALALSGLGASSINTGSNALTFTSSNFNTTATGINGTAIGATTPSTGSFTSLASTGTSNIGSGTGVVTINSSGALNLTGAAPSTLSFGANALTITSSNINVSSTGVVTVAGGQTQDLTTAAGTNPTTLTVRPGNNTTNSGTGALTTVSGGNASGTTSTGGNLTLTAGTGTATNGSINIGTTNTAAIAIGATGVTTTNNGALTSTQTLTASNGLTLSTGAINLTGTSGALALSGLGASSINTGSNALTITSSNFNITGTGINGTAIGATTASTGVFTALTDTGLSASSAVYTDASKNLTSTAPTTGTLGFWNRSGSTLSPGTSGDAITTTGNISTTGTGTVTSAGLLTASDGLTVSSGAINITGTSGALTLSGLGASSLSTTANNLTFSTVTSGTLALTSAGALNLTGAAPSTWSLGANALTVTSSKFNLSPAGVLTLGGGQSADLTTPAATGLTIDSGTTGALNIGTQANAKTITFGNNTGATAINLTSGTGPQTFTSSNSTGTGASSAFVVNGSGSTSGTVLRLTSTSTSGLLFDQNATNTSGIINKLAYGAATSLSGDVTGLKLDLSTNITESGQSLTGIALLLAADTNMGTHADTGLSITQGAHTQNTAAATGTVLGADITMGALTLTSGTALNSHGLRITTGSVTQTAGALTENGILVDSSASTITTGGTINGVKISAPTTKSSVGTYNNLFLGTSASASANMIDEARIAVGNIASTATQNYSTLTIANGGSGYLDIELLNGFINMRGMNELYDDFTGKILDTTSKWTATNNGGGSTTAIQTAVVNGVLRMTAGTASGRSSELSTQAITTLTNGIFQQQNNPTFETEVSLSTLSNNRFFAGFTDVRVPITSPGSDTNATAHHAYIAKRNADTNWQCVTGNGSSETFTDTNFAIVANTSYRLRVEIRNGSTPQVICTVDDGSNTNKVSVTTTMPGATSIMDVYLKHDTNNATPKSADVDYVRVWQDDPAPTALTVVSTPEPATESSALATPATTAVLTLSNDDITSILGTSSASLPPEGLSSLTADVQHENARNPIAIVSQKISEEKQFLIDFVSARITAIRGYFDEIFTKKIHTDEICVKKSDGTEICVNGDQLDKLIPSPTSTPMPTSVPGPTQTPTEVTSAPTSSPSAQITPDPTPTIILKPSDTPIPVATQSAAP